MIRFNRSLSYILMTLFVIGLIGCGDSDDDEETPTTTSPTTQQPTESPEEVADVPEVEVNFAAEESAIRALLTAYDTDVNLARRESDPDLVMQHWLDETGVVMSHSLFGAVVTSRGFQKIKTTWGGIFKRQVHRPHKVTVEELGIDSRGRRATVEGRLELLNQPIAIAFEFQKNSEDRWKIFKADYGNQGIVEQIRPR